MKLGTVGNLLKAPEGTDPWLGRLDRAAEMGLDVIGVWFFRPEERAPDYLKKVGDYAAKKGIELRTGGGGSFGSANPDERKAAVEQNIERLLDERSTTASPSPALLTCQCRTTAGRRSRQWTSAST